MTCCRKVTRFFILAASVLVPLAASAANFDVKVLVDTDNRRSTGCTVNTTGGIVSGIDVILTTTGTTSGATGTVTSVTRQTCVTPSLNLFSSPVAVDGGWNVGVSSIGDLFIESHYGLDLLTWTNVGTPRFVFTTSAGSLTDILITPNTTGGGDIVLPRAGRPRAVATGAPRVITLDGVSADWSGVPPLANGGSATTPAWRFISASAYATQHDLFFNFQIHTNPAAPTANDDSYTLGTLGGTLTVATLGVLNNDDANGQAITAVLVSNPQHGTLTLNPNGGFTYTHDGSLAPQDQFRYVAQGPVLTSNIATVTINLAGSHPYVFTSADSATFPTGQAKSFTVSVSGLPIPALTESGALPSGITFVDNGNGTATLSGTAAGNAGGIYSIVFTAEKNKPHETSQNFTLTVGQPPHINSDAATTFTAGTSGTFTVTATGFPTPTLSKSGALPAGVTFDPSTGALSGTPAPGSGGQYHITFTASNDFGSEDQSFLLTVNEAPFFTSANATSMQTNVAASFNVTVAGFPAPTISRTGTLPSGITFTNNGNGTATISGTAASGTGGTYPLVLSATNGIGAPASQNFTLTVNQPPAITSANAVTFTVGAAGTFTVTATGFPAPAIGESGTLPGGVTYNATTHVLSGTPNVGTGGTYPISFTASNGVGSNAVQSFTLTINEAASFTSANAVTFQTGVAGTFSVTTLGFPKPAITKTGALPSGVTLTDNANGTATLAGTAASGTGGTYSLTLTAANGVGANGTQNFTLTVNQPPAITSANAVTFTVGTAGTFTVTATGFPAPAIGESGTLPSGVTYNSATHVLSGTPAVGTGGVYPITFTASNGVGSNATQNFALTINEAASFTSANAVTFHAGVAGTFTMTTLGYPKPAITKTGALPAGVTLTDNANGTATLAGTPGGTTGGTYPLVLTAANGVGANGTQNFTLTVDQPPAITSANNATYQTGLAGTFTVTTTGFPNGASMVISETGALPSGLTFADNHDGTATIAGTPAALTGGIYSLVLTANNGIAPNATQNFTLTVNQPPAITSANNVTFTVGAAGTFTVTTTGFPTGASMLLSKTGTLPSGVTFVDNHDGTATLSGTPAAATGGTYPLTITANNGAAPNATQNFTLTVNQAPVVTSANNVTFQTGVAGTFTVTTTGFPTGASMVITKSGALPGGVTFVDNNNGTATLAGTPNAGTGGTYPITITANNGVAPNGTQSFTLTVNQPPAITSANAVTFTVGTAGTFTVTTTGFPAPTVSETGALPTGVTFNAATKTLSGTPAAATGGIYNITFTASNGVGANAPQSFTLTINQAPAVTSANNVTFQTGVAGTFTVTTTGFPTGASMVITNSGALPGGVTFVNNNNGTATLSGTPNAGTGGTYPITITANNGVAPNGTQSFTLTVNQPPAITSANAVTFTVGAAGTFTVTATGFPAPTVSETGALPSGVTFNAATKTLSGTPAAGTGGTYNITFTAANGVGANAPQSFTLTINEAASFTSANNVTFQTGVAGTFTITTLGFPKPAITKTGALPSGVTLTDNNDGTATLAGTPGATTGGSYPLSLTATNGVGANGTQNFTLTVNQPPAITSANATTFTTGTAGTFTVTVTGFPAPTVSETGGLPSGVSFNPATKTLSGTPGATSGGIYSISFTATNSVGSDAVQPFTLTVNQAPVITSANAVDFAVSTVSSFTITTTGFPTPTVGLTGTLPAGMSFTANPNGTGTISGTPTAGSAGTYPVTVTATNVAGSPNQTLTIHVWAPPVTVNESYAVAMNTARVIAAPGVLGNDTVNGATITSNTQPSHGTVALAADGSFTYTPTTSYVGADSFTYTLGNFAGNSTGTVSLTVFAAPVANADTYNVATSAAPGVLGNDSVNGATIASYGVNGNEQTTIGSSTPTAQAGTIVLNADGSFTYTAAGGFTGDDTFKYTLSNFAGSSTATVTLHVNIAPVNAVPAAQSTNEDTTLTFSSGNSNAISISDADAGTNSVQVALTATNGIVTLSGTTGLTVTNGANGTSTVTVTGTIAAINTALNGLTFLPTSNYNGAASLQIVTDDLGNTGSGGARTDTDSIVITVNAVNDAPVLTAGATLSYTENQAATAIDTTVTVNDVDNANLASATVQITGNYVNGEDVLSFATIGAVSGSFNAATGTMTLTGSDTLANYQAALRTVKYVNTSDNPSTSSRTVTWIGNDGSLSSTAVTSTITITAVNDAPVLTAGGTLGYTENQSATAIDTAITITDSDSTTLTGATVQITGNYVNGEDVLSFTTANGISGIFTAGTGTLTLSGTASVANYQTALQNVKYANTSDNPSTAARTVTWQVNDGAGTNNLSNTATSTINVTAVNDAPVLTAGGTLGYTENQGATAIDGTITVNDADNTNIASATVQITGNYVNGQDILGFTTQNGITGIFTAGTGTMALTGSASLANYQAALSSVTYLNNSDNPSTSSRTVSWTVNDASANSNTVTSTITITAVDDAPVITRPVSISTNEDTLATFSGTISLADVDSGAGALALTLSVSHGALTLSGTTNLTVTGNGSGSVSASGVLADLNAALSGMTYLPSPDYNGGDTLNIGVNDNGNTGTGTGTDSKSTAITVNAINDAPVNHVPGTQTFNEDTPRTFSNGNGNAITVSDVDAGGSNLTVTLSTTAGTISLGSTTNLTVTGNSTASVQATGTITDLNAGLNGTIFTPTLNLNGPQTISMVTSDNGNSGSGGALGDSDTINLSITAVNDAPVATADAYNVVSVNTLTVPAAGVLTNDTDVENNSLTAVIVTNPAEATTFTLNADGSFTYKHNDAGPHSPTDSFTYKANDGTADSNIVTVTITITYNQRPVGVNDAYSVNEAGTINQAAPGVLANDTDAENDAITAVLVTGPAHASTFTLNANGSFNYTHDGTDTGNDSFTYRPADALGNGNLTTVTITINPINDAPVAVADSYTVTEGLNNITPATSVLANDTDEENNTLTAILVTGPAHASSFTLNANGTFSYTHNGTDTGNDSFTYKANDGTSNSNTVTVTINVTAVNDPPVAANNTYSVTEGLNDVSPATSVLANDTDEEGNTLTAILVSGPSHASSFTLNSNGTFTYTNDGSENASDSFTYKANDGTSDSNVATVTINVTAVNDPPVNSVPGSQSVNEDTDLPFTGGNAITISDADAGANNVTVTLAVAHGTMTVVNTSGTTVTNNGSASVQIVGPIATINSNALAGVKYRGNANYNGAELLTVTTNDGGFTGSGGAKQDVDTVVINVISVDDAPVANNDPSYTVFKNNTLSVLAASGVVANDTDPENDTITVKSVTGTTTATVLVAGTTVSTTHGSLTIFPDGHFNYTPTASYTGTDTFTYIATDGTLDSGSATVTITVQNHTPTPGGDSYTPVGNTLLEVGVTASGNPAKTVSSTVLANDTDSDGDTLTVTQVNGTNIGGAIATTHGSVTMFSNGTFSYIPTAGYTGADSFTYTVNDGSANNATATATVSLTIANKVWYVKNNGAAGTGVSSSPFLTLAAAQTASAAGDYIYVSFGAGTTANQNAGITLKANQQLIGAGVALVVGADTLAAAGTKPLITNTTAAADVVTLNAGNTIKGLTITGTAGARDGIRGTTQAGFTADTLTISSNVSSGLHFISMTGTITITNTQISGNGEQVTVGVVGGVAGDGGTATISIDSTNSIAAGVNQRDVSIQNRPVAAGNITFVAAISDSAVGSTGISILNNLSGTIAFNGNVTLTSGGNQAVTLTTNSGTTMTFANLAVTTTTGNGIVASGGGVLTITTGSINNTGAATNGLSVNGLTFNATFSTINTTGTTTGVSLTSLGNGNVTINGGTISGGTTGLSLNTLGTSTITLAGVTLTGSTTAISGATFGTLSIGATVNVSGATALNLTTGAVSGTFANVSSTGGTNGVNLSAVTGTWGVTAGTLTGATGATFNAAGTSTGTLSFGAAITQGNTANVVTISGSHSGTINFTGAVTSNGTSTGLTIAGSSGAYSFNGTNAFSGTTGIVIGAGGESGSVSFSNNTTNTVSGTAFLVDGTTGNVTAAITYNGTIDKATVGSGGVLISVNKLNTGGGSLTMSHTPAAAGNLKQNANSANGISITNSSSGSISISDASVTHNNTAAGVTLSGNSGTITLNGLSVTANGNKPGLLISGGGTLNIGTGAAASTINSSAGTAAAIDGATASYTGTVNLASLAVTDGSGGGIFLTGSTLSGNGSTITGSGSGLVLSSVALTNGAGMSSVTSSGGANGISLTSVTGGTYTIGGGTLSGSSAAAFNVSGGSAVVTDNGTISVSTAAKLVNVSGITGGTLNFAGAITGSTSSTGITLGGSGGTINFSGGLTLNGGSDTFTASNASGPGFTLNVTGTNNIGATSAPTGPALTITNTTIGASNVTFQKISATGGANAIVLNTTGATGHLSVAGDGTNVNNASGGTMQNQTGDAISLTSTKGPVFNQISIQSTTHNGIKGTTVTDFTLTNSTVNNSGLNSVPAIVGTVDDSNLNFGTHSAGTENNLSGVVVITGNTLTNAYYNGIYIHNFAGTISNATISSNTITSSTVTANSQGSGIEWIAFGSASGVASITKATLNANNIQHFPSQAGINLQCGNSTSSAAAAGTYGDNTDASNVNAIRITSNIITGGTVQMNTDAILATIGGKGSGNFFIDSNGTVATPLGNTNGHVIAVQIGGIGTLRATISNNRIVANNIVGSRGIVATETMQFATSDAPTLLAFVTGNIVSATNGCGIFLESAKSGGTMKATVTGNTVAKETQTVAEGAIQVWSGDSSATTNVHTTVCLTINTNTATGGTNSTNTQTGPGIGIRLQANSVPNSNTFVFNINGFGFASGTVAQMESYVGGQNPGSNCGTFGTCNGGGAYGVTNVAGYGNACTGGF